MKTLAVALTLCLIHTAGLTQQPRFNPEAPFASIAARWTTKDAIFTSTTTTPEYLDLITKWAGPMYGLIKPNGHVVLKAENGCILTGFASPFTGSAVMWTFTGKLEGCSVAHFNQRIVGNIRLEGKQLTLDVREPPFAVGRPPVHYVLKTTMDRY